MTPVRNGRFASPAPRQISNVVGWPGRVRSGGAEISLGLAGATSGKERDPWIFSE